jgi:hypothetical protein
MWVRRILHCSALPTMARRGPDPPPFRHPLGRCLEPTQGPQCCRRDCPDGLCWGEPLLRDAGVSDLCGRRDNVDRRAHADRWVLQLHDRGPTTASGSCPTVDSFSLYTSRSRRALSTAQSNCAPLCLPATMAPRRGTRAGYRTDLTVPLSASTLPHASVETVPRIRILRDGGGRSVASTQRWSVGRTCTGWLSSSTSADLGSTWTVALQVGGVERVQEGGIRHPLAPPNIASVHVGETDVLLLVTEPHCTGVRGNLAHGLFWGCKHRSMVGKRGRITASSRVRAQRQSIRTAHSSQTTRLRQYSWSIAHPPRSMLRSSARAFSGSRTHCGQQ